MCNTRFVAEHPSKNNNQTFKDGVAMTEMMLVYAVNKNKCTNGVCGKKIEK
jgi:hypothetical protein